MDSSSSDEPIKYAPNRLGIALIAAGMIGLVLSVYAIYAMGHWQGIWVYIAIFAFFFTSIACMHSVLSRILDRIILRQIWALTYSDRAKYFMTDNMGRVMSVNPSAQCPKSKQVGETLQTVLKPLLGNPHASLSRLRRMMVEQSHVSEIVLTEHGQLRLSAWRHGKRILWRIEEITQDVAEQAYTATIPALTVSENGNISQMKAVARALLGTRVNRFSMLVNAGELTWNAPNTIETNRGKERYFLLRRKIRHDRSEVFFLPDDMRNTLADLMHLLNRLVGEKVELVLEHDTDLKPVRADKRQLEQVFMNLVVNTRDAMPEGGRIHIKTEGYSLEQALDRDRATIPAGDYISVTVTDEGCGIATDKLTKIFEPFYSTKRTGEGTGLGLSTVYGIVKQTGGYIFVQSAEGQGTEFNLILPIFDGHRTEIAPVIEEPKIQPRTYGDGVILLVEDEAPVRTFASRALQLRGYKVIEAASAEEALDQLSDPNLQIDVFVTDIVMPGRDGPSWVKEALEQRPNTRVVFVSGYAEDVLETQQAAIPNSVFLPKPFSLDDLTETVQQQFH